MATERLRYVGEDVVDFACICQSYGFSEEWKLPYPSQELFHNSGARYKGLSGPVGTGKTVAVCWEALELAYGNSGMEGFLLAPTYRMLEDVTKRTLIDILEREKIPYEPRKSEDALILEHCGSRINFRSASDPDRLRGPNLAWFGFDELTYCPEKSWEQMEARLREPRAKKLEGFAAWTPKGFDWVYGRFIGPERLEDYEAILAQPGENRAVLQGDPQFYERLKRSYDEKFWRQEVLGEYLNIFSGRAYYAFSDSMHVQDVMFRPGLPILWTMDFNVNPMCSLICQAVPNTINGVETVFVLDELALPDSNTREACQEFYTRVKKWLRPGYAMSVYVYGDASGTGRSTTGGAGTETDYKIVRQFFVQRSDEFSVSFQHRESNPFLKDRIACVNAMLHSAAGDPRIILSGRCRGLRKDLNQVGWRSDSHGNTLAVLDKSDPELTHLSDALGYLVERRYGLQPPVAVPRRRQIIV